MQAWGDSLPGGSGLLGQLQERGLLQPEGLQVWLLRVGVLQVRLQLVGCSEFGPEEVWWRRFVRVLAQGLGPPTVLDVLPVLGPGLRLEFVQLLLRLQPLQQHALLRPSLLQWHRQLRSVVRGQFVHPSVRLS